MVFIELYGGLGNQMFQFVFARYIEKKFDIKVFFITDFYKLRNIHSGLELTNSFGLKVQSRKNKFKIFFPLLSKSILFRFIFVRNFFSFLFPKNVFIDPSLPDDLVKSKAYYCNGYWQNVIPIEELREFASRIFKFPRINSKLDLFYFSLIKSSKISIGVHIRRGDYVSNRKPWSKNFFIGLEYYLSSIDYLLNIHPGAKIFYFSDDISWVRNNILPIYPGQIIEHNIQRKIVADMHLMSLCNHIIIANSTFSLWAAFLNKNKNSIIVAPKLWLKKKSSFEFIPENWIIM